MKRLLLGPGALLLAALTAFSPLSAQIPSPTPDQRVTELVANCAFDLPQGYVMEPGGSLEVKLVKIIDNTSAPAPLWSSTNLRHKPVSDQGPSSPRVVAVTAAGFNLLPTDRVKLQLAATLVSKTRDEVVRYQAETPEIPIRSAELGRLYIDKVRARGGIVSQHPTPAAASAATTPPPSARPGATVRIVARVREGVKIGKKDSSVVRLINAAIASTGKEPAELASTSGQMQYSGELGGYYLKVTFPSVALKPNDRVAIDVSAPVDGGDKKGASKPVKGRSQVIAVREDAKDLGLVRLHLR